MLITPPSPIDVLNTREKRLPNLSYKLLGNTYGIDVTMGELEIDESRMSVLFPFASGVRRDGVGDLLEIGGIRTDRHRQNAIVLYDHGKSVSLPIAKAEDSETGEYTVYLDPVIQEAKVRAFFYSGKGLTGISKEREFDHALFCEQLFDLTAKKFVRAGSIGYSVIQAKNLQPDYERGTPAGLHLLSVLMLEASLVVLPANADTVMKTDGKSLRDDDMIERILAMPRICGKPLSPYLLKSLGTVENKKCQIGFDADLAHTVPNLTTPDLTGPNQTGPYPTQPNLTGRTEEARKPDVSVGTSTIVGTKAVSGYGTKGDVPAETKSDPFGPHDSDADEPGNVGGFKIGDYVKLRGSGETGRVIALPSHRGLHGTVTVALGRSEHGPSKVVNPGDLEKVKSIPGDLDWLKQEAAEQEHGKSLKAIRARYRTKKQAKGPAVSRCECGARLEPGETKCESCRYSDAEPDAVERAKAENKADNEQKSIKAANEQNYGRTVQNYSAPRHGGHTGPSQPHRPQVAWGENTRISGTPAPKATRAVANPVKPSPKSYASNHLESREDHDNPLSNGGVPAAKWKPGQGAIKAVDSGYACLECGHVFRTVAAAQRAANNGCPKCGGVDIDLNVPKTRDERDELYPGENMRPHSMKSLSDLRKQYRKGAGHRLRKSAAGSSVTYFRSKDLEEVKKFAEGKGVKLRHMGEKGSYVKAKLTGVDESVGSVVKQYGRKFKSLTEQPNMTTKTMQVKTKDLPPESDGMVPGDQPPPPSEEDADPNEPYGAQVVRRMHQDFSILIQHYHEMMPLLEKDGVKAHLTKTLQFIAEHLDETEELFDELYQDLEGLEGAETDEGDEIPFEEEGEKDLEEVPSEETDDEIPADDSMPTDSVDEEADEPTADEVVEGMEKADAEKKEKKEEKSLKSKNDKSLRNGHAKSACNCKGAKNCKCGKCMKALEDEDAEEFPEDSENTGQKVAPLVAAGLGAIAGSMLSHEKGYVKEAHGFLGELANEQDFGEEHRHKAYHYHKTLGAIGDIEDMADESMEDEPKPEPGQVGGPAKSVKAVDGKDEEDPPINADDESWGEHHEKDHRKMCKGASGYFGRLSETYDFGDKHREEAKHWHRALDPIAKEDEMEVEDKVEDAPAADDESAEEETFEPGEMGEKTFNRLKAIFEQASKNMESLNKRMDRITV